MRENGEDWEGQLITVIQEIAGLGKVLILSKNLNFLILLSKLEGLNEKYCEDFMIYRKTVFRCMTLLTKVLNNE